MEGLSLAEVLSHIIRQLFELLVDLSHELLPIIKVPLKKGIDVSLFGSVCFTITFIILPAIINAKFAMFNSVKFSFIASRCVLV